MSTPGGSDRRFHDHSGEREGINTDMLAMAKALENLHIVDRQVLAFREALLSFIVPKGKSQNNQVKSLKSLKAIKGQSIKMSGYADMRAIEGVLENLTIVNPQVLAFREALRYLLEIKAQEVEQAYLETEGEIERRVNEILEQFKHDFDRGIVMIDGEATLKAYEKALKKDRNAGQNWEGKGGLKERLRDYLLQKVNGVTRLELAEKMPGGPCLIGIHADGTPAIRQRSREIVNVVITNEGKSVLLPHEEVVQFIEKQGGEYAKAVEIVRAVKAKGYRVPPDFPDYKGRRYKVKGLVAASDAVMGGNYVENPVAEGPRSKEWRSAVLECPDDIDDGELVRNITFFNCSPSHQEAEVFDDYALVRDAEVGAILWL